MKIKGSTKIILTDESTGEIKEYNDENMITKGLEMYASGYGLAVKSADSYCTPLVNKGVGGILLFSENLEENEDTMYAPAGLTQVGKASNVCNVLTEDTQMGVYNAVESGLQDDGSYKYSFDFPTSHANGAISCVALTNPMGGIIGYIGTDVDKSNYYKNNVYDSLTYLHTYDYGLRSRYYNRINGIYNKVVFIDGIKNKLYRTRQRNLLYNAEYPSEYMLNSGMLMLDVYHCDISSIRLTDSQDINNNYIETIEIPLPAEILTAISNQTESITCSIGGSDDGKIYFFTAAYTNGVSTNYKWAVVNGKTYHCAIIDAINDFSVSYHAIVNQAGIFNFTKKKYSVNNVDYLYPTPQPIWYYNDYIYIINENLELYRVNPADGAALKLMDAPSLSYPISYYSPCCLLCINGHMLICYNRHTSTGTSNHFKNLLPDAQTRMFDTVSLTYKTSQMQPSYFNAEQNNQYIGLYASVYGTPGLHMIPREIDNVMYGTFRIYPPYLATINNLSSPVVKTASQSMKIVYTLTFEEELPEEETTE